MRAVLSVEDYSIEQLDELVAARLERQAVLGRAYLTAIIDQHVTHRPTGSASVMAEQCAHLVSMAGRPRIALHVIQEGTNVGLWVRSTSQHKATWAFERILGAAMPRAESLDLIRTAEERWKAQI